MRILVESLKRLYNKGSLDKQAIRDRVAKGTINADEYAYITGEPYEEA